MTSSGSIWAMIRSFTSAMDLPPDRWSCRRARAATHSLGGLGSPADQRAHPEHRRRHTDQERADGGDRRDDFQEQAVPDAPATLPSLEEPLRPTLADLGAVIRPPLAVRE